MFELWPNRKIRRHFHIAYTAVTCSCSLAMIVDV